MDTDRLRIAVTGTHGLIGSALVPALRASGHDVLRLVRGPAGADDELSWDPATRTLDPAALADVDAVIHLAGLGIGDRRWTPAYKARVLSSRVDGTLTVSTALAAAPERQRTLLSMSGSGYYGITGDRVIDETAPAGAGFLAEVCKAWEEATAPAVAAGVRVITLRTGPVLAPQGGFLGRMLPLARLGLLSPLGSGRQFLPWVSLADYLAVIAFVLGSDLSGPVNVTGPLPVTMAELTGTLLKVLGRPRLAPRVPAFALRVALGEFADEGVLNGQRAVPAVLEAAGYRFEHPTVEAALRWAT
ncbi:MAG: TIGR01777 family oxidoreductase [Pseudonocardiales bacterium]